MYIAYSNSAVQRSQHRSVQTTKLANPFIKKAIRLLVAVTVLLVVFSLGALVNVNAGSEASASGYSNTSNANVSKHVSTVKETQHVIVERGNTLWMIASEHLPKGENVRSYIEQIKKFNKLSSSSLQEGQVLLLP
jgi:LysM repeat protein